MSFQDHIELHPCLQSKRPEYLEREKRLLVDNFQLIYDHLDWILFHPHYSSVLPCTSGLAVRWSGCSGLIPLGVHAELWQGGSLLAVCPDCDGPVFALFAYGPSSTAYLWGSGVCLACGAWKTRSPVNPNGMRGTVKGRCVLRIREEIGYDPKSCERIFSEPSLNVWGELSMPNFPYFTVSWLIDELKKLPAGVSDDELIANEPIRAMRIGEALRKLKESGVSIFDLLGWTYKP